MASLIRSRKNRMASEDLDRQFKTFLAPEVTSLVLTVNPSGAVNVSPTDWVHKIAYSPPTVIVCKKHGSDTRRNLSEVGKRFVICVPGVEHAQSVLLCSQQIPETESELDLPDVRLHLDRREGELVFLSDMVWTAVCTVKSWLDFESHRVFVCQVDALESDAARRNSDELMHLVFKTFCSTGAKFTKPGF